MSQGADAVHWECVDAVDYVREAEVFEENELVNTIDVEM